MVRPSSRASCPARSAAHRGAGCWRRSCRSSRCVPSGTPSPSGVVEVVQAERLLEAGRVRVAGHREEHRVQVAHVVAADDVGAVRQAVRVRVVRRAQEQRRRVDRAADDDHDVRRVGLPRAVALDVDAVTSRPDALVSRRSTYAPVTSDTFGCCSAGSTQTTCASAFAFTRHGKPSQVSHRMQRLVRGCSRRA